MTILEFDSDDGPITEADIEEVDRLRHPACAADCDRQVCLCPYGHDPAGIEIAPDVYVCGPECAAIWREMQQAQAVAS